MHFRYGLVSYVFRSFVISFRRYFFSSLLRYVRVF